VVIGSSPPGGGVWRHHNGERTAQRADLPDLMETKGTAPNDRPVMADKFKKYCTHDRVAGRAVVRSRRQDCRTGLLLARPHGIKTDGNKEIWIWIGLALPWLGLDGMGPCGAHMKIIKKNIY
jgi:hypothetical protein